MSRSPHADQFDTISRNLTSKRTKSLTFLALTFLIIVAINGLLPTLVMGWGPRYEATSIKHTEYIAMTSNEQAEINKALVYNTLENWAKNKEDKENKIDLINNNAELSEEIKAERIAELKNDIANLKISYYTKYFYEAPEWYADTVISSLSTVMVYYAVFNYLIVKSKDSNINHLNGEFIMKQLAENYLDPDTFEPWLDLDFNRKRKIKQHIRNVKALLKKLEQRTPYAIRKRFSNYFTEVPNADDVFMTHLPALYVEMNDKERAYIEAKDDLLHQLTEQYIQEVVLEGKVKYFKEIKPGFVYTGVNYDGTSQDEYSTIKSDNRRVQDALASKILMSVSISLIFASFASMFLFNFAGLDPLSATVLILMRILPLLLQVYFAINYNNWFMDNQLLPNLKFRENIAMFYLAEMKRRGIRNEPVIINKLELPKKEETK